MLHGAHYSDFGNTSQVNALAENMHYYIGGVAKIKILSPTEGESQKQK